MHPLEELFDALESNHYAKSGLSCSGPLGKLRDVATGLMRAGMDPMTIFSLIQSILGLLTSNTVEEIIKKILGLFLPTPTVA